MDKMEDNITIQLPMDSDGFIEYKCPFCNKRFRLNTNEFSNQNRDDLMCVYCGLSSEVKKFMPENIDRFLQESVAQYVQNKLNKAMKKINFKSNFLEVKYKPGKKIEPTNVHFDENISSIIRCGKCNNELKVEDGSEFKHYCPYCEVML